MARNGNVGNTLQTQQLRDVDVGLGDVATLTSAHLQFVFNDAFGPKEFIPVLRKIIEVMETAHEYHFFYKAN